MWGVKDREKEVVSKYLYTPTTHEKQPKYKETCGQRGFGPVGLDCYCMYWLEGVHCKCTVVVFREVCSDH
jgi:hypothetical protein